MNNGADGAPPNHQRPWSVGRQLGWTDGLSDAQELFPLDLNCLLAKRSLRRRTTGRFSVA